MNIMRYAYLGNLPIKKMYYIGREIKKGFYKNFLFFGQKETEKELSVELWCQYFSDKVPRRFTPSVPQDAESSNTIYLYKRQGYQTRITWTQNYQKIYIEIKDGETSAILNSQLKCVTSYSDKSLTLTIKDITLSSLEIGKTYNLTVYVSNEKKNLSRSYNLKIIDEVIA